MRIKFKKIHTKIRANLFWWKSLRIPFGKKVYFIGTPEYTNLGDSAIAIAQILFLEKCGYKKKNIKEFSQSEYTYNSVIIQRYIGKRYLICGIGGGNMGNLWYNEELFRYSFIDAFPDNPIVIFPQTIFFTDDENGRRAKEDSLKHYENQKNLTLVAREKKSYDTLNELYHNTKNLLSPDIVLSTTMKDYNVSVNDRSGVLLVFRSDSEKSMTDDDRDSIKAFLDDNNLMYRETDMYSDCPVTKENRIDLVSKKMQEFADSKLVITDRLHGMIFAVITETPCIVFSNNHHKIKGTYDWISYLPYIEFVSGAEEAINAIPELIMMKNCKFDNVQLLKNFMVFEQEIKTRL